MIGPGPQLPGFHALEGAFVGGNLSVARDQPVAGGEDVQVNCVGAKLLARSAHPAHQPHVLLPRVQILRPGAVLCQPRFPLRKGRSVVQMGEVVLGKLLLWRMSFFARARCYDQNPHQYQTMFYSGCPLDKLLPDFW